MQFLSQQFMSNVKCGATQLSVISSRIVAIYCECICDLKCRFKFFFSYALI